MEKGLEKGVLPPLSWTATARWAEPEASARRAVHPTSSSPRGREGACRREDSSASSRGCSSYSVRQGGRHPARADHHLLPRRASEHFQAGARPLLVASYLVLRALAAARSPHRGASSAAGSTSMVDFECTYSSECTVLIRQCAAGVCKSMKVFCCQNGPSGYDT